MRLGIPHINDTGYHSHVHRWCRRNFKINISLNPELVSVSFSLKVLTTTRKGGQTLKSILRERSHLDGVSHLKDQTKRYRRIFICVSCYQQCLIEVDASCRKDCPFHLSTLYVTKTVQHEMFQVQVR